MVLIFLNSKKQKEVKGGLVFYSLGNYMKVMLCPPKHTHVRRGWTDARELSNDRQDRAHNAVNTYHVTLGWKRLLSTVTSQSSANDRENRGEWTGRQSTKSRPLDFIYFVVGNGALRDLFVVGVCMLCGYEFPCIWSSGVNLSIF